MVLLFVGLNGVTQTVTPNENTEICPHTNYQNAQTTDARTIRFDIDFGSESASDYEIVTFAGDPNKPVGCKVVSNIAASSGSAIGTCYIAFDDQRGETPSFTTNKKTVAGVRKTFKFPFMRCLKGLAPQLIGLQPPPSYPICATGNVVYNTVKNARYKRTDDQTEFGADIPLYEYSVPKGWKVGSVTSTGQNNFILASPNQVISYDAFNTGEVKVRASQRGYICDGLTTPAAGDWVVIPFTRDALSFTSSGATSITVTCGVASTHTFTVNNGPNSSCGTYEWNLGSANNNWNHNGSPAQQIITTNTNSITLTTSGCGKPGDVTVTLSGANSVFGPVTIPVTMNSQLSISDVDNVCTTRDLTISGLGCNEQVTWESSNPAIATVSGNGGQATVTKVGRGVVTITATVADGCGPQVLNKSVGVGVPDRPKSFDENGNEITTFQLCAGTAITICTDLNPIWDVIDYEWEIGTGDFDMVGLGSCAAVSAFLPGSGFISVRARNACGFSSRTLFVIQVLDCNRLTTQRKSVELYPNPASNSVTISVSNQNNARSKVIGEQSPETALINEVKIYDSYGMLKIYRKYNNQQTATMNVSSLQKGVYLVEVKTGNGIEYKKLIIQK